MTDWLGRGGNVLAVADDVYVPLRDAEAVTFVGVLAAGDTWTLTEASDAAGTGAAALATMDHYSVQATVGAVWQDLTQTAASTIVTTSSQDVVVVTVNAAELSAGMDFVKLASTSTGTVFAILHDLKVQRAPSKLAALV
jgi:hypothetical protein